MSLGYTDLPVQEVYKNDLYHSYCGHRRRSTGRHGARLRRHGPVPHAVRARSATATEYAASTSGKLNAFLWLCNFDK